MVHGRFIYIHNEFLNAVNILVRDSYSPYSLTKSFSSIIFLRFAMNRQATTSTADRSEYPRKLLKTALVWPVQPSAILSTTESAARLICEVRMNNSSLGKLLLVRIFISSDKSRAFCHTCKFSNLNAMI